MVARDSTGYPFLAIAQHNNLDYGQVLSAADALKAWMTNPSNPRSPRYWEKISAQYFFDMGEQGKGILEEIKARVLDFIELQTGVRPV